MRSKEFKGGWLLPVFCLCIYIFSPVTLAEKVDDRDNWHNSSAEPRTKTATSKKAEPGSVFVKSYAEAKQLVAEKQFDLALKKYKSLTKKYKQNPALHNDIGVIYRLQENYKLAIRQFNKVIKRFPGYAPAYENLADTLTKVASVAYVKAAQIATDNAVLQKKAVLATTFHQVAMQSADEALRQDSGRRNALPVSQQVVNTMHSWINAWNMRDLSTYLSHYSSGFVPDRGRSVEVWAKRHQDNFAGSDYIRVYLDSIKMRQIDKNTVAVSFRELYESNLFETSATKQIVMEKVSSSWLIKSEQQI